MALRTGFLFIIIYNVWIIKSSYDAIKIMDWKDWLVTFFGILIALII